MPTPPKKKPHYNLYVAEVTVLKAESSNVSYFYDYLIIKMGCAFFIYFFKSVSVD